jgi:putative ABC transport system permease protein
MNVTDDYFAVTGMQLVEGRWFSRIDDGAEATPVVINRALAGKLFPNETPLGKQYKNGNATMKIVGVVDEYRNRGELSAPVNFAFKRFSEGMKDSPPSTLLIKLKPGVSRMFETRLNDKLKSVRNNWSYQITPLRGLRDTMLKEETIPLVILAIIGAFMLVMVGFGLFGVLWQNTTRRIPEIGIRRALGATSVNIYRQIIAEQMLLSSGAMLIALILLAQLPITGAMGNAVNWTVFGAATVISMAVIYLISLLCALYPGWRASRLSPTEALHYE